MARKVRPSDVNGITMVASTENKQGHDDDDDDDDCDDDA